MLHDISDIHEKICQGDEKIFRLYKEMGANLFTTYSKYNLNANLLYTVFRMDSPDFYLSLKEKTLAEYSEGGRNRSFYDQIINILNIYDSNTKIRINDLFELCTHTKNAWNIDEVIKIYSEAKEENVNIREDNQLDRNNLLINMLENLYGYTYTPVWMGKKNDYYFEGEKDISPYEKNMLLYLEKMLDFINPTLEEMIDEKILANTFYKKNALLRLLTIDNEADSFKVAPLIFKKYNITINHDEIVKSLSDLSFKVQMHYFNNGLNIDNPKPLIKYSTNLLTIRDYIAVLLEENLENERNYPSEISSEMHEKRIMYEKMLLKREVKLITEHENKEKVKQRL